MEKKIILVFGTIGHVGHGSNALASAMQKALLENGNHILVADEEAEIGIQFESPK